MNSAPGPSVASASCTTDHRTRPLHEGATRRLITTQYRTQNPSRKRQSSRSRDQRGQMYVDGVVTQSLVSLPPFSHDTRTCATDELACFDEPHDVPMSVRATSCPDS